MKAAILNAPDEMSLQETDEPRPDAGDVVLKVRAATICGTDIRIFRGRKTAGVRYPSVLGHEFAGEIVETGGHDGLSVGDRVSLCPAIPCGACNLCKRGQENLCREGQNVGYEIDGAFAELIRIPAHAVAMGNLRHLPDAMPFAEAALLEPLSCVLNGQNRVGVSSADTVLVLGTGPIGMLHILLARHRGALKVYVSEPNEARRKAALDLGADVAFDPSSEDVKARLMEETGGRGVDVVICAIGVPALARQATDFAAFGGRISLFAGFNAGQVAEMDVNAIHYNELAVHGAFGLSRRDYDHAFDMVASGRLDLAPLVTHRYALGDALDAFEMAESGDAIKVVIENG